MDYEKMIWQLYQEEMASRDNADYEPDYDQMQKLVDAYAFFVEYAKKHGGRVEKVEIIPKREVCGVTAYFTLFAPFDEDLERFKKVMQDMSAITIDSLTNGDVCIDINIPGCFKKKK